MLTRRILRRTFSSQTKPPPPLRMASPSSPSTTSPKIHEGVFAINKPPTLTSAQVIRDVQSTFHSSSLFAPWFEREQARKDAESHNQKKKRRSWKQRQPLQVKIGHGGTLDPLATGVLILGVGSGTKVLGRFLDCTKSYDTVVLFGAATDSYDAVGKVVARKAYEHITREMVEEALRKFRGKIMQRPPIFSALRVQGKRLYEYAREGKDVPVEIEERPVEVEKLELGEWMEGGTHEFRWPTEEVDRVEKEVVEKVLGLEGESDVQAADAQEIAGGKRRREDDEPLNGTDEVSPKRARPSSPTPEAPPEPLPAAEDDTELAVPVSIPPAPNTDQARCPAPACRLRMTVTSGFYVRSLAHDLGTALGSAGLMASLVRTRQGEFELGGRNVLEYSDLEKTEEIWGEKVRGMLEEWNAKERVDEERGGEGRKIGKEGGGGARENLRRRNSSSDED